MPHTWLQLIVWIAVWALLIFALQKGIEAG